MSQSTIEQKLNQVLAPIRVEVRFGKRAVEDLAWYDKHAQERILALILKQAKKNPLLKPKGIGEPLHGPLAGFGKIKSKSLALRVIYRPVQEDKILMDVIAIGPRERERVYELAAKRVIEFKLEMAGR